MTQREPERFFTFLYLKNPYFAGGAKNVMQRVGEAQFRTIFCHDFTNKTVNHNTNSEG